MILVQGLALRAGRFSLKDIAFEVPAGQCAILMGKTGSGKTTILEAICGLKPVQAGLIRLGVGEVTRLKPAERGIGYVPQDLALFRTMTVRAHLALALVIRKWPRQAIDRRVTELAELLRLEDLLDRKPHGLSGGEAQRVALGRALAYHPQTLLLDEPLSALDDETREEMYALLQAVQKQTGVTTLHVTHNLGEAKRLADRLFVLQKGVVRQEPVHSVVGSQ